MISTTRWTVARRRKRLVISQTVRDRARTDPRRSPREAANRPAAARHGA